MGVTFFLNKYKCNNRETMKKLLLIVFIAGLAACNNTSKVKIDTDSLKSKMDTMVNRIENSKVIDSIKLKGGRILDTVEKKGSELWDSTKTKGGRLIDKTDGKLRDLKLKDSAR